MFIQMFLTKIIFDKNKYMYILDYSGNNSNTFYRERPLNSIEYNNNGILFIFICNIFTQFVNIICKKYL